MFEPKQVLEDIVGVYRNRASPRYNETEYKPKEERKLTKEETLSIVDESLVTHLPGYDHTNPKHQATRIQMYLCLRDYSEPLMDSFERDFTVLGGISGGIGLITWLVAYLAGKPGLAIGAGIGATGLSLLGGIFLDKHILDRSTEKILNIYERRLKEIDAEDPSNAERYTRIVGAEHIELPAQLRLEAPKKEEPPGRV